MINIISKSIIADNVSGPKKVVENLIKGLDLIGYPYVINKRLDACTRLWIHDDTTALKEIRSLDQSIKVLVGPNLYIRPRNIPTNLDISRAIFICPSPWAVTFWTDFGFNMCPVDYWPTGIDTNIHTPSTSDRNIVLIYFKQRFKEELEHVEKVLQEKNIAYKIISYGYYNENEYSKLLAHSKYVIWLGRHETQGIALQEALATNVPMIVCEVPTLGHWTPNEKEGGLFDDKDNAYSKAEVAPYFDERCGIKIRDVFAIKTSIEHMENTWNSFSPRNYILENLSLEKQARDFVMLYDKHFRLTYEAGMNEKILKKGNWINASFQYMIYFKIKKLAKKLLTNH
jgi:glycosyltransferase involved in cell wall biosynthesis